jgi:predicted TIM-barrel fold metal-dependent hydrolase
MGYVDCDSHVLECDETWDFFDPQERSYRPKLVTYREATIADMPPPSFWIIGDTWTRCFPGNGNWMGYANSYSGGATQLTDLAARAADLDALGIDVQLLLSTVFIGVELDNGLAEAAVCRSYNRWVAERVNADPAVKARFPWALRTPIRMLDRAYEELEFGKENGAVAIQLRGIEHGMHLSDPYLWPLWERVQDLDLAVVVHLGTSVRRMEGLPLGHLIPQPPALMKHTYELMAGFHAILSSDFDKRFPLLRWGFVEGGASWMPAVLQQHARFVASQSATAFMRTQPIDPSVLAAKNIFVTCETDEDIKYLAGIVGNDVLCVGTDYGHNDLGSELNAHHVVAQRRDISPELAHAIVDTNGRRLLAVDPNVRPAPVPARILDIPHIRSGPQSEKRAILSAASVSN